MTEIQIVCQNCGAKYRLPASFHSDKAKCKGCGAAIDVAAQRGAAAVPTAAAAPAEPAKAKPAAAKAKPAESKEKEAGTLHRAAPHGTHGTSSRRAHAGKDKDGDEGKGHGHRRHGHEKPAKKGMSPMLIGGSLGGIALIVVVLIFLFGGGDDPANTGNVANASGAGANPAAAGNAVTPKVETPPVASADAAKTPDAVGTGDGAAKPADAAAEKPPEKPAVKPAAKAAEAEILTKADVFDPKTLEPLAYPETIPQARRDELEAMIGEIDGTGRKAAIRAKDQLTEIGWASLFGLVNKLRTFDYTTPEGTRDAFEINQLLTAICDGTNTGFKPAAGDELPLKDMNHNALTVKAWQRFVRQYPDDESFKAFKKKKDAKRKDG